MVNQEIRDKLWDLIGPRSIVLANPKMITQFGEDGLAAAIDIIKNPLADYGGCANQAVLTAAIMDYARQGKRKALDSLNDLAAGRIAVYEEYGQTAFNMATRFVRQNPLEKTKDQTGEPGWECPTCGEMIEVQFSECWQCAVPEESEKKEKSDGLFAIFFSALILVAGGFFIYSGFFYMLLNDTVDDGFGIFFLLAGMAITLVGTVIRGWERKWKIWGTMSIFIGLIVPIITISTVTALSSNPNVIGDLSQVSTGNCALLGAVMITSGIFLIHKHRKLTK